MKKWFLKILKVTIDWLSIQYIKYSQKKEIDLPYNPLSPTNDAEDSEHYIKTIEWALNNSSKIKNIAITGSYGSGKSSIIKTFEKKHEHNRNYNILNISLATFEEKETDLRLIELSVLQQLFYHEKDDKIPDSGFKKIKNTTSRYLWLFAIGILAFMISFLYLVYPKFLSNFWLLKLTSKNIPFFHYLSVIIVVLGSFLMIFKSIRILRGFTIKKIGVSNASIEIDNKVSKSIFNNHIDEILYFFEVTVYNIVVIEDLDRFEKPEVFTKLREINLLINNSKKVEKDVVFIYAIRDDMFSDKDRTKFFDFMIPIIPVINFSNSRDKLLKLVKLNEYKIPEALIDDISLFIDDMRLLYNIMNEYYIYHKKLNYKLDQGKLLSMIIYKNIYPNDFTKLSQSKGNLYEMINHKYAYINQKIESIDNEINIIKEEKIKEYERAKSIGVKELRISYLYKLIEVINEKNSSAPFVSFKLNDEDISMSEAIKDKNFKILREEENINYEYFSYGNFDYKASNLIFSDIEDYVYPDINYKEREDLLTNNSKINDFKEKIEELEEKKNEIRKYKIKDLIINQNIKINSEINKNQVQLINVLLRNGYLGEDYMDYISIFHEGSLSKKDHQFLINIKTEKENEFDFPIEKKENLVKRIDQFEYEKKSTLNYSLLDFLFESSKYKIKKETILKQLSNESNVSIKFIDGYINHTAYIEKFINQLCNNWIEIWNFLDKKSNFTNEKLQNYFKLIIKYSDVDDIKRIFENSRETISRNKSFLLVIKDIEKLKGIIKSLSIKFTVLNEDSPNELLDFIYENNFYAINKEIVKFVLNYKEKSNLKDFETENYRVIKESGEKQLINYIEENINEYVEFVYLTIEKNAFEKEEYYISLLNNEKISEQNIYSIMGQVKTVISNISDVQDLKIIKALLGELKILASWGNIFEVYRLNKNKFIPELTSFINAQGNANILSESKNNIDTIDEDIMDEFWESLLLNNKIDDYSYSELLDSIPKRFETLDFKKLSETKVEYLISKNILMTNPSNFNLLKEHFESLRIKLIENDSKSFIENNNSYRLSEDDVILFLRSIKIEKSKKEQLIEHFEVSEFEFTQSLLTEIGSLIIQYKEFRINEKIIKTIGITRGLSSLKKIKIFNKYIDFYLREDISSFLESLEQPYSLICEKGKRPLIKDDLVNREFVENLKLKNYISKYEIEKKKGIRISTFKGKKDS